MPFFIRVETRPTMTKYLVEAKDADDAGNHDGEYLGYVDGDADGQELFGPFETKDEVFASVDSYTEGR